MSSSRFFGAAARRTKEGLNSDELRCLTPNKNYGLAHLGRRRWARCRIPFLLTYSTDADSLALRLRVDRYAAFRVREFPAACAKCRSALRYRGLGSATDCPERSWPV